MTFEDMWKSLEEKDTTGKYKQAREMADLGMEQLEFAYNSGFADAKSKYARPRGEWIYNQYDGNANVGNWHCSECRHIVYGGYSQKPYYSFCPNCGADMRGVE